MVDLSDDQSQAVDAVKKELTTNQIASLHGFAGTGKSTIAKTIAEGFGSGHYLAYTGKAADVLRSKGGDGARTIHSAFYSFDGERADGQPKFFTVAPVAGPFRRGLIVLDEASMVPKHTMDLILEHVDFWEDLHLLCIGDPFQLPPVNDNPHEFMSQAPTAMLSQIHRQAAGDPILRLATQIRLGQKPDGEGITFTNANTIDDSILADADIVLTGRNETRRYINKHVRKVKGYDSENPAVGERVVCLRNNPRLGIYNGSTYVVTDVAATAKNAVKLTVRDADGRSFQARCRASDFTGVAGKWEQGFDQFDFGHAITVHKAQGSEFDRVVLANEPIGSTADLKRRWMYTAITRAKGQLTIMQMA